MLISFECGCGRKLWAKSEKAGRACRCPDCGLSLVIPGVVFQPAELRPPKGRLWLGRLGRDPAVWIGAIFPVIVVMAFAGYLVSNWAAKARKDRIRAIKIEADRHFTGQPELALEGYEELVRTLDGRTRDAEELGILDVARNDRDHLVEVVRANAVKAKAAADAQTKREEFLKAIDRETTRLIAINADLSGTAWVTLQSGSAFPLRGMRISLIPRRVLRSDVEDVIAKLQAHSKVGPAASDRFRRVGADDFVDTKVIWALIRLTNPGLGGPPDPVKSGKSWDMHDWLCRDSQWPEIVRRLAMDSTETRIDGTYSLRGIHGGQWYLAAQYHTDAYFVEWVADLAVDQSGKFEKDFHERGADMVQRSED